MKLWVVVAALSSCTCFGGELVIGTKDKIVYSNGATEADAQRLGEGLKSIGFLTDADMKVLLERDDRGALIGFIVDAERWKPGLLANFEIIARMAEPTTAFGYPMRIRILGADLKSIAESSIARGVLVGKNDRVYPSGSATEAEAQTLGAALKKEEYFQDRECAVMLYKSSLEGTVITFIVQDKEIAHMLTAHEIVVRTIASSVGGLPIKLRMTNEKSDIKRELWIHPGLKFHNNQLLYSGAATREEAVAMLEVLKAEGAFSEKGSGIAVLLSKTNEGAIVSFPIKTGAAKDPAVLEYYKAVGYKLAPAIGGLPIKVRLLDDNFSREHEIDVQ